jgi:tyrosinase
MVYRRSLSGYVTLFEQVIDQVAHEIGVLKVGDQFALPYWNYVVDRKLPEPFRVPGNAANPLFVDARTAAANGGRDIVDDMTLDGPGDPSFGGWKFANQRQILLGEDGFSNILEIAPHGSVHVAIGRGGGLMGTPARAARDPVFWLHHAQIDRLWESWRKSHNGSDPSEATPDGKDWNDALFHFVSLSDEADVRQARNVLDADGLGYRYDKLESIPAVVAAAPMATPVSEGVAGRPIAAAAAPITVGSATVRVPLVPAKGSAAAAEPLGQATGELTLRLADIRATVDPGTDYDIFVQAKGSSGEPSGQPIARLNLFGRVHEMADHEGAAASPAAAGITVSVPLAASLATAGVSELRPEDLVVTIRPNASPAGDIIIERIELVVR